VVSSCQEAISGLGPAGTQMKMPGKSEYEAKGERAQELRRTAALAREAARVRTSGSGGLNRLLLELAAQLEREAHLMGQE